MSARALILFTIAWIQAVIGAPNIILITVDSVGWGDFGRNDPTMLTPNIDRMATDGIFLENHYGVDESNWWLVVGHQVATVEILLQPIE